MGNIEDSLSVQNSSSPGGCGQNRCLRPRICLRLGCGHCYQPRRWNQRFCQEPACSLELRRWQAAKRQRRCREDPASRQRHAASQRRRRRQAREKAALAAASRPSGAVDATAKPVVDQPPGAWSRCKRYPKDFCDRPGCYEPTREALRVQAKYCSDACREAMRRVVDRERKWLWRQRFTATCYLVSTQAGEAWHRFGRDSLEVREMDVRQAKRAINEVRNYGSLRQHRLSCAAHERSEAHVCQTHSGSRPRPPPASG